MMAGREVGVSRTCVIIVLEGIVAGKVRRLCCLVFSVWVVRHELVVVHLVGAFRTEIRVRW